MPTKISFLLLILSNLIFSSSSLAASAQASRPVIVIGDRAFSQLTSAERDYYEKSFSYAMETLQDTQIYEWRTAQSEGQIRVGERFQSKSGILCRGFSEIYDIKKTIGKHAGYACKRDARDGWCKLYKGDMLSCALEPANGVVEELVEAVGSAENKGTAISNKGKNYQRQAESGFFSWWPF